ncbi:MAG: hypothetical protein HQL96_05090 [Magnetococcales bacterium]|nr:hypothetical protein [Magnetococcales bacterium]
MSDLERIERRKKEAGAMSHHDKDKGEAVRMLQEMIDMRKQKRAAFAAAARDEVS